MEVVSVTGAVPTFHTAGMTAPCTLLRTIIWTTDAGMLWQQGERCCLPLWLVSSTWPKLKQVTALTTSLWLPPSLLNILFNIFCKFLYTHLIPNHVDMHLFWNFEKRLLSIFFVWITSARAGMTVSSHVIALFTLMIQIFILIWFKYKASLCCTEPNVLSVLLKDQMIYHLSLIMTDCYQGKWLIKVALYNYLLQFTCIKNIHARIQAMRY